ncbi:MAG TPA: NADH-quinone oxidoreductase subunit A [bacterium]|nr:NADH-quinone oxidoreductase subunit A [bacterium]
MISAYVPVLVHLILATLLAVTLLGLHRLAGGRAPSLEKSLPYESGVWPIGSAMERVPIRYYLIAMLFILFDVEIVFVYPWAVLVRTLGSAGLLEMFTFLAILGCGYVYLLKRKALEWE